MTKAPLDQLSGLPGVYQGSLMALRAKTVTGFMAALRKQRACHDAGDHGAVIVWLDDDGRYRCEFCQFRMPKESQVFMTKARVREWLSEWLPKQRDQYAA